jgi:hypothetical protein
MATSKQAKTTIRTNFATVHSEKIKAGSETVIEGWFGASLEAMRLGIDASKYASASISPLNAGEARWSDNTIRQNVTAGMKLINKYGTMASAIRACELEYATASWNSLKAMVAGDGQRAKKSNAKRFDAKREAKKYTKAQLLKMLEAK